MRGHFSDWTDEKVCVVSRGREAWTKDGVPCGGACLISNTFFAYVQISQAEEVLGSEVDSKDVLHKGPHFSQRTQTHRKWIEKQGPNMQVFL